MCDLYILLKFVLIFLSYTNRRLEYNGPMLMASDFLD